MDSFLSSEGRIGQVAFIIRVVVLAAIVALVFKFGIDYFNHDEEHKFLMPLAYFFGIVASIIALLILLMQVLKRLRDMGKGPFWSVLLLVPGLNVLFVLYAAAMPSKK